jgi:putative Holliday junction resolvase
MNMPYATLSGLPVSRDWVIFLAIDPGEKRTGMAVGNRLTQTASPLRTIEAEGKAKWPMLQQAIDQWQPDAVIMGVPFHPDGAEHENTLMAKKFARQIEGRFQLPVIEVDERYSTTEAHALGARDADAAAACIILEQFLRSLL